MDFCVYLRVYVREKNEAKDAIEAIKVVLKDFDFTIDYCFDVRLGLSEI